MKIRVYYNLYSVDNDDFATLTTICNKNELLEILRWIQCSSLTEFLTLEVIPE